MAADCVLSDDISQRKDDSTGRGKVEECAVVRQWQQLLKTSGCSGVSTRSPGGFVRQALQSLLQPETRITQRVPAVQSLAVAVTLAQRRGFCEPPGHSSRARTWLTQSWAPPVSTVHVLVVQVHYLSAVDVDNKKSCYPTGEHPG